MTFVLSLLFMLFVFWRPQEWLIPQIEGWPILDMIVFASLLTLLLEIDQKRVRSPMDYPQTFLLLGLWIATLMSHVVNTYFAGLLATWAETFKYCFFTLLLFCVLDRPSRLRWVARLFVFMGVVMSIHALMQQRLGYGFAGHPPALGRRMSAEGYVLVVRSRYFGIFNDPNDLAQSLATCIPFSFVIFKKRSWFGLLVGAGLSLLLFQAVAATHSRGGDIALITIAGFLIINALPSRWFPALMAAGAIGFLVVCPFSGGFMDGSAHERVVFWGEANWAFLHSPLFGVGYDMLGEYITRGRAVHNAYVLCYGELGLFGYWFWFGLLVLAVLGAWRTRSALVAIADPETAWLRRFSGFALAGMMGFLSSSYFLSRAFVYPLFFLIAILGVLPFIAERYLPDGHAPLINAKRDVLIRGTFLSLGSVMYIYVSILILNKAWGG